MSEFWGLMENEFGTGYARVLAGDLVLSALDGRTALEALDDGLEPKAVWVAVCDLQEVPQARRWGKDVAPRRT